MLPDDVKYQRQKTIFMGLVNRINRALFDQHEDVCAVFYADKTEERFLISYNLGKGLSHSQYISFAEIEKAFTNSKLENDIEFMDVKYYQFIQQLGVILPNGRL